MKIIKVIYTEGEARFVLKEFPDKTFCISLEDKTTIKEVTDELKSRIPQPDTTEQIFNDLNLKKLEGTDI